MDARYSESRLVTDGTGWAFTNLDIIGKDLFVKNIIKRKDDTPVQKHGERVIILL
jgi:hypothetical protein